MYCTCICLSVLFVCLFLCLHASVFLFGSALALTASVAKMGKPCIVQTPVHQEPQKFESLWDI